MYGTQQTPPTPFLSHFAKRCFFNYIFVSYLHFWPPLQFIPPSFLPHSTSSAWAILPCSQKVRRASTLNTNQRHLKSWATKPHFFKKKRCHQNRNESKNKVCPVTGKLIFLSSQNIDCTDTTIARNKRLECIGIAKYRVLTNVLPPQSSALRRCDRLPSCSMKQYNVCAWTKSEHVFAQVDLA